jgi:hypothetical protein
VPDTEFNLVVLLSVDEIHGDIQLIHDPSVAKVNGTYYLYSTGKVTILSSSSSLLPIYDPFSLVPYIMALYARQARVSRSANRPTGSTGSLRALSSPTALLA